LVPLLGHPSMNYSKVNAISARPDGTAIYCFPRVIQVIGLALIQPPV
jgi:hypothetical protein